MSPVKDFWEEPIGFIIGKFGKNDPNCPLRGIYQKRKGKAGVINVKMKFYAPYNPNSEAQQYWRNKLREAVRAWQNLTSEQKKLYNIRGSKRGRRGYNLFISEYLKQ
jgi:hypothetical protein